MIAKEEKFMGCLLLPYQKNKTPRLLREKFNEKWFFLL